MAFSFGNLVDETAKSTTGFAWNFSQTPSMGKAVETTNDGMWHNAFTALAGGLAQRFGGTSDSNAPEALVVPAAYTSGGVSDIPTWAVVAGIAALGVGVYMIAAD